MDYDLLQQMKEGVAPAASNRCMATWKLEYDDGVIEEFFGRKNVEITASEMSEGYIDYKVHYRDYAAFREQRLYLIRKFLGKEYADSIVARIPEIETDVIDSILLQGLILDNKLRFKIGFEEYEIVQEEIKPDECCLRLLKGRSDINFNALIHAANDALKIIRCDFSIVWLPYIVGEWPYFFFEIYNNILNEKITIRKDYFDFGNDRAFKCMVLVAEEYIKKIIALTENIPDDQERYYEKQLYGLSSEIDPFKLVNHDVRKRYDIEYFLEEYRK